MVEQDALPDSASAGGAMSEESSVAEAETVGPDASAEDAAGSPVRPQRLRRVLLAVVVLAIVALGAATGFLLNQKLDADAAQDLKQRYLQAARQSVLDLTTISAATVDDDVARVLERSTGSFRDQFDERSDDFVAVVQQANVQATGTITEAGIENADDTTASVLVAATSSVTNSAGAEEEPRIWRLRITLENGSESILVSNVEFVP